jgi:hypothetical protein
MRYRLAKPADLATLRALIQPSFQPTREVETQLFDVWRRLIAECSLRVSVVEDPALPPEQMIQMIGASVFVRDDFVNAYLDAPSRGLSELIYEHVLGGKSPVLPAPEIRLANSREGLNLVMLHFALRNPDLANPHTQELMFAVNSAFFFFYGGYRLKTAMQEVYGKQAADYMQAGGFHVRADFGDGPSSAHLLLLRREEVQPAVVNPLSFLFYPMNPRIHFSPAEQRVLELALLNESDAAIASACGVSADAVKKTWRRAFERTARVAPHVLQDDGDSAPIGARGIEKRRYLLDYLRIHLEELRPHEVVS